LAFYFHIYANIFTLQAVKLMTIRVTVVCDLHRTTWCHTAKPVHVEHVVNNSEGLPSIPVLPCQYLIINLFLQWSDSPRRVLTSSTVPLQTSVSPASLFHPFTISSNKKFLLIFLFFLVAVFPVVSYVSIIPPVLHTNISVMYHRSTYTILANQSISI